MIDRLNEKNNNISNRGKTIRTLIKGLQSFENKNLEVKISFDYGESSMSIGLVGKINNECVLMNCEN
jgi:hypothetical protein